MTDVTIGSNVLTEYTESGNSKTWVTASHTAAKPQVVIQKRKIPDSANPASKGTSTLKCVFGTEDADGNPMPQKVAIEAHISYPIGALSTDVTTAVQLFQDLVADASFDDLAISQLNLS